MVDIMAFGAHPDDIEFGCGATLVKMAAQNKSIVLVDLTLGEKGTNGTPEMRRQEGEEAAGVINAKRIYLNFNDCAVFDTYEGRLQIVKVMREYRPKLILGPMWKGEQNHPDHLACGLMLRYACRYARFAKILPEIPIYKPDGILHYSPFGLEPDFLVDVSDYIEGWKKMMACHKSQLLTNNFIDWNLRLASTLGLRINKAYAQGFIKGNPIEIEDLMTVCRGTREL